MISAVAFATILAVVAGLTLASSSSFAHDIYANVIRKGKATEKEEVRAARWATVVIGVVSIGLGALARDLNVAGLVALAFAVAASANLPTILYSLFWKRFTTQGALWSIYGGLISAVGLVLFSPVVSGKPTSMFKDVDFYWFPLENPGIISIPLGFLLGWLGTVLSKEKADTAQVRGAGGPVPHRHRGALIRLVRTAQRGRVVESLRRGHVASRVNRAAAACQRASRRLEIERDVDPITRSADRRGGGPQCSSTPTAAWPPTCASR